MSAIKEAFLAFIHRIPFYGLAILCLDNEPIQSLIPRIGKRFATYGMSVQADFQAKDISFEGLKSNFLVFFKERELGRMVLNLPGIHNVSNALAAVGVGMELGIGFEKIREALAS